VDSISPYSSKRNSPTQRSRGGGSVGSNIILSPRDDFKMKEGSPKRDGSPLRY
jgi:hypothetical protein